MYHCIMAAASLKVEGAQTYITARSEETPLLGAVSCSVVASVEGLEQ